MSKKKLPHYELIPNTKDKYKKVESNGDISYNTYTFYRASKTMQLNK